MSKIVTINQGKLFASNPVVNLGGYAAALRTPNYELLTKEFNQIFGYVPDETRSDYALFFDEARTAGTASVVGNRRRIDLNAAGWYGGRTCNAIPYQGGIQNRVVFTVNFNPDSGTSGTAKYAGIYCGALPTIDRGITILYVDSTDQFFVQYFGISTVSILQSNWDDPLDGTGPSGCTLSSNEINTFFIDYDSDHMIRWGVYFDGDPIIFHTVYLRNDVNELSKLYVLSLGYFVTGAGPSLFDIYGFSAWSSSELHTFSARSISTPFASELVIGTADTLFPIAGLRLEATGRYAQVQLTNLSVLSTSGSNFWYGLFRNPSYSVGTTMPGTWSSLLFSNLEYNIDTLGTASITNPLTDALFGSYVSNNNDNATIELDFPTAFNRTVTGGIDEFILAVGQVGGATENYYATINFREFL